MQVRARPLHPHRALRRGAPAAADLRQGRLHGWRVRGRAGVAKTDRGHRLRLLLLTTIYRVGRGRAGVAKTDRGRRLRLLLLIIMCRFGRGRAGVAKTDRRRRLRLLIVIMMIQFLPRSAISTWNAKSVDLTPCVDRSSNFCRLPELRSESTSVAASPARRPAFSSNVEKVDEEVQCMRIAGNLLVESSTLQPIAGLRIEECGTG